MQRKISLEVSHVRVTESSVFSKCVQKLLISRHSVEAMSSYIEQWSSKMTNSSVCGSPQSHIIFLLLQSVFLLAQ